jgi:uncharacterized protein
MENNQTNQNPNESKTYNLSITMDSNKWAMLCHASAVLGFVIPFGNILGPLIVWQLKKNEIRSVAEHGVEALNFQIFVTAAAFALMIVSVVLTIIIIGPLVGMVGILGLLVFTIYYTVMASISAYKGNSFKYPYTYSFVK